MLVLVGGLGREKADKLVEESKIKSRIKSRIDPLMKRSGSSTYLAGLVNDGEAGPLLLSVKDRERIERIRTRTREQLKRVVLVWEDE